MSETLTVTPERVRKAASACPQAKAALETLFPEAFHVLKPLKIGTWVEVADAPGISPRGVIITNNDPGAYHICWFSSRETYNNYWTLADIYTELTTIPRPF